MLTYTRYILQFTAASGFKYSAGRTTDTEDSLGRFGKNSSHMLYGPVGVTRESERTPTRANSAGAGRPRRQRSAHIVGSSTDGPKHMEGVL